VCPTAWRYLNVLAELADLAKIRNLVQDGLAINRPTAVHPTVPNDHTIRSCDGGVENDIVLRGTHARQPDRVDGGPKRNQGQTSDDGNDGDNPNESATCAPASGTHGDIHRTLELRGLICHRRNVRGNAAATDTPAIFEDLTAARVHPLVIQLGLVSANQHHN
jgi:hypothetical protein